MSSPMLREPMLGGENEAVYDLGAKGLRRLQSLVENIHGLIEKSYRVDFYLESPTKLPAHLKLWASTDDSKEAKDVRVLFPHCLAIKAIDQTSK